MMFLIFLLSAQAVVGELSQKTDSLASDKTKQESTSQNLMRLQQLLMEKLREVQGAQGRTVNSNNGEDLKAPARRFKSLPFHPFPPLPFFPYNLPPPPGYFYEKNDEISENSYPSEWLSRTEPFRKNTPLLDSPTYYIRLPPNPYVFVPGMGYVSRPPSLTDPEVLEDDKQTSSTQSGNDLLHDPFYRIPINFVANGKPTSVYQLQQSQPLPRPDSNLITLDKGPYVFNGKPNEIYLLAQIYDALYGDELHHYYP